MSDRESRELRIVGGPPKMFCRGGGGFDSSGQFQITTDLKMFSSRIFWRIFGTYAALSLLGAAVFIWLVSARLRSIVVEHLQRRLHDSAVVLRDDLRDALKAGRSEAIQNKIEDLAKQNATRITLVAEDGTVVGDSERDPATMDDHRERKELLQARTQSEGVAQRPSTTLGIPMMYYALPVKEDGRLIGFVRVALPMKSVNAQVASVQRLVWGTALVVSLFALAVTYVVVGRIIRPLGTLTAAAQAVARGDLNQVVSRGGSDELGTLGDAFNTMTKQLASRIEQLKDKHRQLEESRRLLETVFATMVEAVVAVDSDQRMLFANPAARSLLGLGEAAVEGHAIWEVVRSPAVGHVVRAVLEEGRNRQIELTLSQSGAVAILTVSRLPGVPAAGAVLVLHDVTELRRLENLRRDFVSNVSHELKTPLTSIQAYADTLLEGALDDPNHNREFMKRIGEGAERLNALIQDLLALAHIESDEHVFDVRPVSLREVADVCIRSHLAVAEAKRLQLTVEHAGVDLHVLADEEGLQTILDNLIDNAINYTPPGGSVTLRCRDAGDNVRVEVADSGIGVPREHHDRIFERFYRVDRARSREVGGTGLGLAIVKHLVQEFRGRVSLVSEPGVGSTFTVEMPKAAVRSPG
ncbi:MAG: ATP-binding protein [Planctomycetaceae bacterium]